MNRHVLKPAGHAFPATAPMVRRPLAAALLVAALLVALVMVLAVREVPVVRRRLGSAHIEAGDDVAVEIELASTRPRSDWTDGGDEEWIDRLPRFEPDRSRHIADYIAGMTDRFAISRHAEIYGRTPEGLSNV